ncbi:MAG: GNAT family N-acetyltransferase [Saprospiraceae bacterium]|nr:GNAT family N-acetyltransferase [Saprospiraceae bacterium]
MTIHTPRLILRPYTYDDLYDYHALNSDKRLLTYELHEPYSLAETKQNILYWMQVAKETDEAFGHFEMAIELRSETKVIGLMSTNYRDINECVMEVGFRIHVDYQKQGFTTEALKAILEHTFMKTDVHRVFGCTDARNTACIRVFEKVGMQREGLLRQNIRLSDETYADEVVYAILAND